MADLKVPQYPSDLTPADDDLLYSVDVSDTTDDPTGSSKNVTIGDAVAGTNVLRHASSTGVLEWEGMTSNTSNIDITAGKGVIIDNETDSDNPTRTEVTWGAQTVAALNIATNDNGWVYADSAGVIQQQATALTDQQRRENIFLGRWTSTDNVNVTVAQDEPDSAVSIGQNLHDLFRFIRFGNDGIVLSPNGANLSINRTAGDLVADGINFGTNAKSPNRVPISALTPVNVIRYGTQNNIVDVSAGSLIKPGSYDVGGTVTAIPGSNNQATIQRVVQFASGNIGIFYGQTVYTTLTDAVAAVGKDTVIKNPLEDESLLIANICVIKGATDLSDTSQARILATSKFGESSFGSAGVSTATLQSAYDNASEPEILTDATRGAVTMRRGSAADTDNIIEGQNGAGTNTFEVTGEGTITSKSGNTETVFGLTGGVPYIQGFDGVTPANNQLAFYTGSFERVRIDNNGNVGIGTSSPTNPLTISTTVQDSVLIGSSAATVLQKLRSSTTANDPAIGVTGDDFQIFTGVGPTERVRIDSNGNVGIGTIPSFPLHVKSGINNGIYESITTGGNIGGVGASNRSRFGGVYLTNPIAGSAIEFAHQGVSGQKGAIAFMTKGTDDDINQPTEVMVIENNGNVGIGTTSPNEKLTVEGYISGQEQASAPSTSAGYGKFYTKTDGKPYHLNDAGTETDLSGGVGASNFFKANKTANLSLTTSEQDVIFNEERYDDDAVYNNSTGVFTAASAGKYKIKCKVAIGSVTDQDRIQVLMYKNTSTLVDFTDIRISGTSATIEAGTELDLALNDTIKFAIVNITASRGTLNGAGTNNESQSYIYGNKL